MYPLRKTFDLYNSNMIALAMTLTQAGGNANAILANEEFKEVLAVLAANNIRIEPEYVGGKN